MTAATLLTTTVSLLALGLLPSGAAEARSAPQSARPEGTRLMAELLARLAETGDEAIARHMPHPDLREYFQDLAQPPDARTRILLDTREAYGLLVRGETRASARRLARVARLARANPRLLDGRFLHAVRELLAVTYLRLAEDANHRGRHQADPCLLLLSGDAQPYARSRWSRLAIREYLAVLRETPGDLTSRWLLNLAYMTIGEYPRGVPSPWLIPPQVFRSEYPLARFTDVAPQLGLDVVGRAGGVITEDFDDDGYIDVFISSAGLAPERDQLRYFHNDADGSFTDRTREAGLIGITGGLNITSTDYDNDGRIDVFIPRGAWLGADGLHPPSLLHNTGNGTFVDVTAEAGLFTLYPTHTAAWADFDNDGWVDLFVGNETTPQDRGIHPCQLFRNNGDGTFTDVADDVGLLVYGWVKGAAWGDYDNDGRVDLYVSRLFEPNVLFHNDGGQAAGAWSFSDVTEKAGVAEPRDSFPTWFWDYDNDGWLDIFVASCSAGDFTHVAGQVAADYLGLPFEAETPRLFRNNRDGTFTDVSGAVGLHHALYTMGANFGDLDNDGWLDMYLGTGNPMFQGLMPNRMFRNAGGERFEDVTMAGGFGHLQKGHGIAFADLDGDGDQDIVEVLGGVYPADTHPRVLLENPGFGNHWITLELEGVRSNRAALGARIRVRLDSAAGPRDVFATVTTGGSLGASSLQQEMGLGAATAIRSVEVTWPATGTTQVFEHLALDRMFRIREGDPVPVPVDLKRLRFRASSPRQSREGGRS